jgi:C-methyltransferase C-terminal domain
LTYEAPQPRVLPAVIDASAAQRGLRVAGTDIPVAAPARLAADKPDAVLLFVPDLLAEVRDDYPEVEAGGDRCVDAQTFGSGGL